MAMGMSRTVLELFVGAEVAVVSRKSTRQDCGAPRCARKRVVGAEGLFSGFARFAIVNRLAQIGYAGGINDATLSE
jgi:hypothetical protein